MKVGSDLNKKDLIYDKYLYFVPIDMSKLIICLVANSNRVTSDICSQRIAKTSPLYSHTRLSTFDPTRISSAFDPYLSRIQTAPVEPPTAM